jgi:hypothetical protein
MKEHPERNTMRPHLASRVVVAAAASVLFVSALAGCAPSTSHIAVKKTSSPKPTPTAVQDAVIHAPAGGWVTFDRVLVGGGIFAYGGQREVIKPATPSVYVYDPGDGPHTVPLSANLGQGTIQRQLLNFTGADGHLMLVVASTILIPAKGLTPPSVDSRLDSYSVTTGSHIATYDLQKSTDTTQTVSALGVSRTDVVGADLASNNGGVGSPVGVNMRTGKRVWAAGPNTTLGASAIAGTSTGTLVLESATEELDPFGNRCIIENGIDTATGKSLWTVDSTKLPDPTSPANCSRVRLITFDSEGGVDSYSSFGAFFGVNISIEGYNLTDKCQAFDGATGVAYAYNACVATYRYDPIDKLVVDSAGDINHAVVVYDLASGKALYTVTADQRNSLDLTVAGLSGGYLYTKTSGGTPIVDVASGKVVANNTTNAPALTVGRYSLYSNGTLSLNPHLGSGAS